MRFTLTIEFTMGRDIFDGDEFPAAVARVVEDVQNAIDRGICTDSNGEIVGRFNVSHQD